MTDKERLEEIKGRYMEFEYDFNLRKEDIEWLIEQAERVQELESRIADDEHFVVEILEQNKRYREAIEKAIGGCRYTNSEVAYILQKALEGEK